MLNAFFITLYLYLAMRLAWTDWCSGLLPDKLTCPLLWSGLLYQLLCFPAFLPSAVWGAIAGYLSLWIIYQGYMLIYRQEGIGYGDIKLLAALGAWHGWQMLNGLLLLAATGGCSAWLLSKYFAEGRISIRDPLPFGTFLAAAGILTTGLAYWPPARFILGPLL